MIDVPPKDRRTKEDARAPAKVTRQAECLSEEHGKRKGVDLDLGDQVEIVQILREMVVE